MISIQINDVKNFMKHLLLSDTFDQFLLMHGSVSTSVTFELDGKINKDFYGAEYDISPVFGLDYTPWVQQKELILSLIKGKYTPISFKFILYPNSELQAKILSNASTVAIDNINNLVLTIRYNEFGLTLTSGISNKGFILDKTAEEAWDEYLTRFIANSISN